MRRKTVNRPCEFSPCECLSCDLLTWLPDGKAYPAPHVSACLVICWLDFLMAWPTQLPMWVLVLRSAAWLPDGMAYPAPHVSACLVICWLDFLMVWPTQLPMWVPVLWSVDLTSWLPTMALDFLTSWWYYGLPSSPCECLSCDLCLDFLMVRPTQLPMWVPCLVICCLVRPTQLPMWVLVLWSAPDGTALWSAALTPWWYDLPSSPCECLSCDLLPWLPDGTAYFQLPMWVLVLWSALPWPPDGTSWWYDLPSSPCECLSCDLLPWPPDGTAYPAPHVSACLVICCLDLLMVRPTQLPMWVLVLWSAALTSWWYGLPSSPCECLSCDLLPWLPDGMAYPAPHVSACLVICCLDFLMVRPVQLRIFFLIWWSFGFFFAIVFHWLFIVSGHLCILCSIDFVPHHVSDPYISTPLTLWSLGFHWNVTRFPYLVRYEKRRPGSPDSNPHTAYILYTVCMVGIAR